MRHSDDGRRPAADGGLAARGASLDDPGTDGASEAEGAGGDRRAKYQRIAEELAVSITGGKWSTGDRLPGVRQVAEHYQVALATAARALESLVGRGLIKSQDRSGMYVVSSSSAAVPRWAFCLRITPGPWHQTSIIATSQTFMEVAPSLGASIVRDAVPDDLGGSEAAISGIVRDARKSGITGLFLVPSRISEACMLQDEQLIRSCRNVGLPVVLVDRNLRGDSRPLELDVVCMDNVSGGFACAMHLFETGRRRLAFVRGGPTSSHNDRLAGFLLAHHSAMERGLLASNVPFPKVLDYPEDPPSHEAYRVLCNQLLEDRVDGAVCYHDRVAFGLIIDLLARGKRVPDEMSLTGFQDQLIGREYAIGVTTYPYPARAIAEQAIAAMRRRIEEPSAPPLKFVVPSRLIVRESSVGRARERDHSASGLSG